MFFHLILTTRLLFLPDLIYPFAGFARSSFGFSAQPQCLKLVHQMALDVRFLTLFSARLCALQGPRCSPRLSRSPAPLVSAHLQNSIPVGVPDKPTSS
jgi:hypothetical protein